MCPCSHQLLGKLRLEDHTFEGNVSDMDGYPIAKEKKGQAKEKENTSFSGGRRGRAGTRLRMSLEIQEETIRRDRPVSWSAGARAAD